jgi:predicted RecA/RadA family phage recombinase
MGRKISDGKSVKATVPANTTVTAGQFVKLDGVLGLAVQSVTTDATSTGQVVLNIEPGEYETSQINAAEAFNAGAKVYWDNTNKRFTTTPTGNQFAGIVTQAKDANNVIWFWFAPQQALMVQAATVAAVASADAGATYTAAEQLTEVK